MFSGDPACRWLRALAMVAVLAAPVLSRAAESPVSDVLIRMDERRARAAGIDVTRVQAEAGTAQTMLPGTVAVPPQQLRIVAAPAAGLVESVLVAPIEPVKPGFWSSGRTPAMLMVAPMPPDGIAARPVL